MKIVSLFESLKELADTLILDIDYNKQILNFCAYDNELSVKFQMRDGTVHNLKDVCELIN